MKPLLERGSHHGYGACSMEWISLIAHYGKGVVPLCDLLPGLRLNGVRSAPHFPAKTGLPECTNESIARAVIRINDLLDDDERQELLGFLPRVMRCHSSSADESIALRLGKWVVDYLIENGDFTPGWEEWARGVTRGKEFVEFDGNFTEQVHFATEVVRSTRYRPTGTPSAAAFILVDSWQLYLSDLLDAWEKIAADEGVLHEQDLDEELLEFAEEFFAGRVPPGSADG